MTVEPSGKFVYVVNEAGTVSVYTISSDGTLKSAGETTTPAGALAVAVTSPKK